MIFTIFCILLVPFLTSAISDTEIFNAIDLAVKRVEQRSHQTFLDDAKVCYEDIGCFTKTGPMKQIGDLPDTPEKINTKFFAYSHSAATTAHEVNPKDTKTLTAVTQNQSLAIVIHGFNNDGKTAELISLKDSLIKIGNLATVIMVDWKNGAVAPWYPEAATNTQLVGRQVAHLVNVLKTSHGIHPENVHLLGFSLGAQVAGFAGKFSQSEYKWKFGRITALDSAAPLFESYPGSFLTHEDATFVDAIHTSAGNNILAFKLGFVSPIGHVDFYPNGGSQQPRCEGTIHVSCNHYSSVVYMDASLSAQTKCLFNAFKCQNWEEFNTGKCADTKGDSRMGFSSASLPGRGSHYLKTTKDYPFC